MLAKILVFLLTIGTICNLASLILVIYDLVIDSRNRGLRVVFVVSVIIAVLIEAWTIAIITLNSLYKPLAMKSEDKHDKKGPLAYTVVFLSMVSFFFIPSCILIGKCYRVDKDKDEDEEALMKNMTGSLGSGSNEKNGTSGEFKCPYSEIKYAAAILAAFAQFIVFCASFYDSFLHPYDLKDNAGVTSQTTMDSGATEKSGKSDASKISKMSEKSNKKPLKSEKEAPKVNNANPNTNQNKPLSPATKDSQPQPQTKPVDTNVKNTNNVPEKNSAKTQQENDSLKQASGESQKSQKSQKSQAPSQKDAKNKVAPKAKSKK